MKIIIDYDHFQLDTINRGFIEYAKTYGPKWKPEKMIIGERDAEDLRGIVHTGIDGHDFGDRMLKNGVFEFGNVSVTLEIKKGVDRYFAME